MIKQQTRKACFKKDNLYLSGAQPHNSNQVLLLTIIKILSNHNQQTSSNHESHSRCTDVRTV